MVTMIHNYGSLDMQAISTTKPNMQSLVQVYAHLAAIITSTQLTTIHKKVSAKS